MVNDTAIGKFVSSLYIPTIPLPDGNGRIGRLIMFNECLRNGITPFIIEDNIKEFYYRGLSEWPNEQGYLIDTCLAAQDRFKIYMDYFGLKYSD